MTLQDAAADTQSFAEYYSLILFSMAALLALISLIYAIINNQKRNCSTILFIISMLLLLIDEIFLAITLIKR